MSRYSTRYDASTSHKGLESSSLGSYRSSNLSGYSGHGYGGRSDSRTAFSSSSSSSAALGSGRLSGSYTSRSAASDSLSLPRSSSFGKTEVLSSSTPRDHVEKSSYSSSLGRSSSATLADDTRGSRYSSRKTSLSSSSSYSQPLESRTDAATERRLRLAERRRRREEGLSETGSDNSKESSVERASSLRRDSDADNSAGTTSSSLSRRLSARRLQESTVAEQSEGRESSPDVSEPGWRRSARLREMGGGSEDTASSASQRRRCQERAAEHSARSHDTDDASKLLASSEARRARRQKRLEAESREVSGSQDDGVDGSHQSSTTSSTIRPWRQRFQKQDSSESKEMQSGHEKRIQDELQRGGRGENDTRTRPHSQDQGEVRRRRSLRGVSEENGGEADKACQGAVVTEGENRSERIARYKEERRKQLAHIASITSTPEGRGTEPEVPPSLFSAPIKEKEDSPCDRSGQTVSRTDSSESVGSSTLMSRLRALRRGSEEEDSLQLTTELESDRVHLSDDTGVPASATVSTTSDAHISSTLSKLCDSSLAGTSQHHVSSEGCASSLSQSSRSEPFSKPSATAESSLLRDSHSPSPARNGTTTAGVTSTVRNETKSTARKPSVGSRELGSHKATGASSEVGPDRKPPHRLTDIGKSKSPSPVTSRLMASTVSSAAKGQLPSSGNRSTSSRSSPSPGAAGDKPSGVISLARAGSVEGESKHKPVSEHRAKDATVSSSHSAKSLESKIHEDESSTTRQSGSKYLVRIPFSQQAEAQNTQRQTTERTRQPSSLSGASSAVSTDMDSGVGSLRPSSSSFSSNRSPDKDTLVPSTIASSKTPRLQRTARVVVSSSSSREGSEEKQLQTFTKKQTKKVQNSVKRAASMPSKSLSGEETQGKCSDISSIAEHSRTALRQQTVSSSSHEKDTSPPKEVSIVSKSVQQAKSRVDSTEARTPSFICSQPCVDVPSPLSPTTTGLDDILAKNAEFLSSDEEAVDSKQASRGGQQLRLRTGEESKLRRSLKRKAIRKTGSSSSKDDVGSSARDSKDGSQSDEMEMPVNDVTVSVSASDGGLGVTSATAAFAAHNSVTSAELATDQVPGVLDKIAGGGEIDSRRCVKESTPDSDSVFHTASSSSSSASSSETSRRRRQDKSELRKSDLNKASPGEGTAQSGRCSERGGRGDQESTKRSTERGGFAYSSVANKVSDMRTLFSGLSQERSKPCSETSKSTHLTRHPSRGKEFSQLLSKFSSSSEASSNERSDGEGTGQRRRMTSFRRPASREGSNSSDSASLRNTPERTQSLRIVRSTRREDDEKQRVERSGSFKSNFMKKTFSPVPFAETSEELRQQDQVDEQHEPPKGRDSSKEENERQARNERFTASLIEESMADNGTTSVCRVQKDFKGSQSASSTSREISPETWSLAPSSNEALLSGRKEKEQIGSNDRTITSSSVSFVQPADSSKTLLDHRAETTKESVTLLPTTVSDTIETSGKATNNDTTFSVAVSDEILSKPTDVQSVGRLKDTESNDGTSKESPDKGESETVCKSLVGACSARSERSDRSCSSEREENSYSGNRETSTVRPTLAVHHGSAPDNSTSKTGISSLRRAESMKQPSTVTRTESYERKGILKRSGSLSKHESRPMVDPQLVRIMEQRRQKELETSRERGGEGEQQADAGVFRARALSAAEEIQENIKHMREMQNRETNAEQADEESSMFMSVSDRIFKMQGKIEEERHASITPKSPSGSVTPKTRPRPLVRSGNITPRKQVSVDEGVSEVIHEESSSLETSSSEEMSGMQLMKKLEVLATQSVQYEERRQRFQKRQREDWRTRTQPVTLEEIQQADSLDTVSSFRAEIRRKASQNIFDQIKNQDQRRPVLSKGNEFPLDLVPEKRGHRSRRLRHKTLPVTAEELNAIPEGGELMEPVSLRETNQLWKRDSRTDSGILSGSEVDSLGSDSLRSLTLEMDLSDNDPSRLSVSSKTSMFRSLDDRAKQDREKEKSASGAKRYIDRKKRERSRTQPVTDDEVKTAAGMSDEKKPAVKIPQPEVVNRPKSGSISQEADEEEDDQLTQLSLSEKVKLFSQKQKKEESAKPPPRTNAPAPRRRPLHRPSRFNTQPVTPEELEKASKISPLAMSFVKPPDPELLMGLKLKDQQELMMMHAEATLSQCSSRAGSRPCSQPGSRRGSVTQPDLQHDDDDDQPNQVSDTGSLEFVSTSSIVGSEGDSSRRQQTGSHSDLPRAESEPRGILKKTKSTEHVPTDNAFKPLSIHSETTTAPVARLGEAEGDRSSPTADLVLPSLGSETEVEGASGLVLTDEDLDGESTTDPGVEGDECGKSTDSRRRARAADRKAQAERYLTQPAPHLTSERSPQSKRKYEGRHMTQPITPSEMKEAESSTTPTMASGGSIADRLNQLKTSGEENWKRRLPKGSTDGDTPLLDVKLRDKKGSTAARPVSISDRLLKLEVSAEQWKDRVEDTDAKSFTVANKMSKAVKGSESPLVAKIKASSKKDLTKLDDSSNASSPLNSPSTPTKEFLPKVPLPKEIITDPDAVKKAEESKKKKALELKATDNGEEEAGESIRVEVPKVDEAEIEMFFSTKGITDIADRVDLDIDDFDNIFIEANEILPSVKKIRPTRKNKATSRNPLKTVSQFLEIQTEYVQTSSGTAGAQLQKMKPEGLKSGFALEALAGLASKENFSKVELRKTEPSSFPACLAMRHPFSDLMLLHVKGRRNVQMRLVEPSSKSINSGDCYILVTMDKIINWVGEYSNIIEKAKAAEVANFIHQKRDLGYKGTAAVQTVDQSKDHLGAGKHFWAALRGEKECQASGPDEEDELYESSIIKTNMVYRLIDGALHPYEQYWGAIPRHAMLDKKEVLVFDFGAEFYVWQGKGVSATLRKLGMSLAQKLWDKGYDYSECAVNPMGPLQSEENGGIPTKAPKRPDWAIFGKVNQNMETILFREKFADWPDTSRLIGVKRTKSNEIKADFVNIKAYDAKKMIPVNNSPVTLVLDGANVGRGKKWEEDMQGFIKGTDILTLGIKVWHVLEFDHFEMPEGSYGQFHQGDTYVVRWQFMITNAGLKSLKGQAARHSLTGRERCAYFFWQGQDSTINEKGASALMTVELDEERGPQVRVVQCKEPPCFLSLFEGNMIVHTGKREDASTNTTGPWRLYSLRGDEAGEVCLLEIPVSIGNLRSCSSLILLNTHTGITYVWHGVKSPEHLRQLAVGAAQNLKKRRPLELDLHEDAHIIITEIEEGEEKSEIWSALDNKDRSLYCSLLSDPALYSHTLRLFFMTSVSLTFEVTEQLNPARLPGVYTPFPFFQSDLYKASQPAQFLLDAGSCVYLWQGWWPVGSEEMKNVLTGSAIARYNVDRRCAMETTLNYCKEKGNGGKVPEAYLVCAGVEPLAFQNLFPFWECDSIVHDLALQEGRHDGYCERVKDVYIKLTQTRYPLEVLQERPLPDGVDPLKLESYLADEEFEEVLEMKREEFYALHTWKQTQLKQALGLF